MLRKPSLNLNSFGILHVSPVKYKLTSCCMWFRVHELVGWGCNYLERHKTHKGRKLFYSFPSSLLKLYHSRQSFGLLFHFCRYIYNPGSLSYLSTTLKVAKQVVADRKIVLGSNRPLLSKGKMVPLIACSRNQSYQNLLLGIFSLNQTAAAPSSSSSCFLLQIEIAVTAQLLFLSLVYQGIEREESLNLNARAHASTLKGQTVGWSVSRNYIDVAATEIGTPDMLFPKTAH